MQKKSGANSPEFDEIVVFYNGAKPIPFPHAIPGNRELIVEDFFRECDICGSELRDTKGQVTDHLECSEFRIAGICMPCRRLSETKLRIYNDGRTLQRTSRGWIAGSVRLSCGFHFWAFLKKLFS